METFSKFNKNFYERVKDISTFDCEEFNMLKVVLDGIRVDYTSKGKVRAVLFYPIFILEIYYFLKRLKNYVTNRKIKKIKMPQKSILFFDVIRTVRDKDDRIHSLFFYNIKKAFLEKDFATIANVVPENYKDFDLSFDQIKTVFEYEYLTNEEKKLRKKIIETYKKISKTMWFTDNELGNIRFAFSSFFHLYKVSDRTLKLFPNVKKSFIICHYHKEGQILALKRNNIECIELQHGLIAEQDVFYVFPENIKQSNKDLLFASKIFVYGEYWKDVLLKGFEYKPNQISILGYYHFNDFQNVTDHKKILQLKSDKKILLITTQTTMHSSYINYINWLSSDFKTKGITDYLIIVKPHPAEDVNLYLKAFKDNELIKVTDLAIQVLFEYTSIHVSVYSTTLFDALRYNTHNFSLRANGFEDYVDEILTSGIAKKLETEQNPLDLIDDSSDSYSSEYYYSDFNIKML